MRRSLSVCYGCRFMLTSKEWLDPSMVGKCVLIMFEDPNLMVSKTGGIVFISKEDQNTIPYACPSYRAHLAETQD